MPAVDAETVIMQESTRGQWYSPYEGPLEIQASSPAAAARLLRRKRSMPVFVLENESSAARRRVYFDLRLLSDGVTPATAEGGGNPEISIDGGGWTTTGISALAAVGNGRYYADLTQGTVAVAGRRIETRYKSANTIESPGDSVQVVGFDASDGTRLGLSALPNAAAGTVAGLPIYDSQLLIDANVRAVLASLLSESQTGNLANNLSAFYDVNPTTTQTVDDVSGGGSGGWSTTEQEQIRHRLGIDGNAQAPSVTPSLATAAAVGVIDVTTTAIRGQTDQLTFTTAGKVDARVDNVAGTSVSGPDDLKASTVTVASLSNAALAQFFTADSGETQSTAVSGSVVSEVIAGAGGTTPAAVADAVWDAARAGHLAAGTMGEAMDNAVALGIEASVDDVSPTAVSFVADDTLTPADDFYNNALLIFLDGPNQGIARPVSDYQGSNRTFTLAFAFPAAPQNGNRFRLTGLAAGSV